ncbi:MAG: LamG domain-containing protein [Candidatus Micrarchaeia archaeon]
MTKIGAYRKQRRETKSNKSGFAYSARAQSAMEYLMTYGWAILIIAVVLGALFQLGVFNGNNFVPKAPPGACQVFRPNGPGSTFDINLEGECQGELPQYVSTMSIGGIVVPLSPLLRIGGNTITISFWFKSTEQSLLAYQGVTEMFLEMDGDYRMQLTPPNQLSFQPFISGTGWEPLYYNSPTSLTNGNWNFVVGRYNGSGEDIFLNGALVASNTLTGNLNPGYAADTHLWIGYVGKYTPPLYFNGSLANMQIYNVSLSQSEIQALYREGIGGSPTNLQGLVAWWPLNGNANDYSGDDNNGAPTNVMFVNNWWQGYTPP